MRIRSFFLALLLIAASGTAAHAADAVDNDVNSLGLTATYDVNAAFGWDDRRVTVGTTATVTNATRWTVSTIAFNLATLRTGHADVKGVAVDGVAVDPIIDDQTILVPLATPLVPGGSTQVAIDYTARLNASSSVDGDDWEFARIGDVLTAYRWIPWLTRTTPFNRPNVGDPFVTCVVAERQRDHHDRSRRHVRHQRAPDVVRVGLTQTFVATDVRDFNLAASPSYRTASTTVAGTEVTFFYRGLPPATVLDTAARAIRSFSSRIAPFPAPAADHRRDRALVALRIARPLLAAIQRVIPAAAVDGRPRGRAPVVLLGRRQRPGSRAIRRRGRGRLHLARPHLALRAVAVPHRPARPLDLRHRRLLCVGRLCAG